MPLGGLLKLDLLYFFSGFIFMYAAVETVILAHLEGKRCAWGYLGVFFFLQGTRLLWGADAFAFGAENPVHLLQTILEASSLGSLFCFGLSFLGPHQAPVRRRIVFLSVTCAIVLAALLFSASALLLAAYALLGIGGGVLTCVFLPRKGETDARDPLWMMLLGAALGLYCLLNILDTAGRLTHVIDARSIVQTGGLGVIIVLNVAIMAHQRSVYQKALQGAPGLFTRIIAEGAYVILPLILAGGWFLTASIGTRAEEEGRENAMLQARSIAATIQSLTDQVDGAASSIAHVSLLRHMLADSTPGPRSVVQEILDQAASMDYPYDYSIADARGMVVASSNHDPKTTLIGRSVAQETWFTDARSRGKGRSYVRSETEQGCSYYHATAIDTPTGVFLGVVTVRASVGALYPAFTTFQDCFLVDETGTIFLSGDAKLLFHRLWNPVQGPGDSAPAGPPPGSGPPGGSPPPDGAPPGNGWGAAIRDMPDYGQSLGFYRSPALVTRISMAPSGWSLVLFSPIAAVSRERLVGIAATFLAMLLMSVFIIIAKIWLISAARVARSESLYRTLIQSSPNWVSIVSPQGAIQFTDALGPHILGMEESEILGSKLPAIFGEEQGYRVAAAIAAAYDGSAPFTDVSITSRDGTTSSWHLHAVPLSLGEKGQPAAMLIGTDITESREAERRLLRAERNLHRDGHHREQGGGAAAAPRGAHGRRGHVRGGDRAPVQQHQHRHPGLPGAAGHGAAAAGGPAAARQRGPILPGPLHRDHLAAPHPHGGAHGSRPGSPPGRDGGCVS
jgi:PAS domain S-box-containing protein